jgi:hypothetical protein
MQNTFQILQDNKWQAWSREWYWAHQGKLGQFWRQNINVDDWVSARQQAQWYDHTGRRLLVSLTLCTVPERWHLPVATLIVLHLYIYINDILGNSITHSIYKQFIIVHNNRSSYSARLPGNCSFTPIKQTYSSNPQDKNERSSLGRRTPHFSTFKKAVLEHWTQHFWYKGLHFLVEKRRVHEYVVGKPYLTYKNIFLYF